MDYLAQFLETTLAGEGVADPRGLAEKAAADLRRARLVDPELIHRLERNRRIYDLRMAGIPEHSVAVSFDLTSRMVRIIVRDQMKTRRVA